MPDFEIVTYTDANGLSRIYPPTAYRDKIIQSLHVGGRKEDSMSIIITLLLAKDENLAQTACAGV